MTTNLGSKYRHSDLKKFTCGDLATTVVNSVFARGVIAMPRGLHVGLCHAFLVKIKYCFRDIIKY